MKNRKEFDQQLLETGMLHRRMAVDEEDSLEYRSLRQAAEKTEFLWDGIGTEVWETKGMGTLSFLPGGILRLETNARSDTWPEGSPADGDYCAFGALEAALQTKDADWQAFNRLHFQIRPECKGMHSPMIAIQLYNNGKEKLPDKYGREGYHTIHLKNSCWNDCVWEFPSLPRDCVTSVNFIVHSYGKELSMDDRLCFTLKDIRLEYVSKINHTLGWQCPTDTIILSTEGYWSDGGKTAVTARKTDSFQLCGAESNEIIWKGVPQYIENEKGSFFLWDFSAVQTPGVYYLQSEEMKSETFPIASHPLYQSVWKVVHFLYCERCGYPVGGGHGTCHGDIIAEHNGVKLAYNGGWHDAGDVSQQTLQTAEVVHSLLETAERVKQEEPSLFQRILEEAVWGLDFILRMRFSDGYRATSAGIRRWSDGFIGNMDDCEARVHNHAFENFLMAGVEAYASQILEEVDPPLSWKAYTAACEDYQFARRRFEEKGMELPSFYEHSYNSSLSQYWATASWAASQIYSCQLKGLSFMDAEASMDKTYAVYAADYAGRMLACQESGNSDCPASGFFYREPDHKQIVHFNHQSREQIYMQALEALCLTQPEHKNRSLWEQGMRLYAGYLKKIFSYAQPYGMLPAGIHKMGEYQDDKTFPQLHLMTTFEEDSLNYKEQLQKGIPLNTGYCLRHFPVWFSFRGNTAIHLSSGKAASILGRYLHDPELIQIAREQIYWLFGKNPFGQSLVYGAGRNFAQQYGALNGEMVGSIPVGIETRGNDDVPFWPMENNATYKEVWTTSAGRFLWLAADLY